MKVVDHLKKQLHDCSLGVMSAEKLKRAEDLVGQIEEAWNNEEVYWWQRSQITWLNSGDKNTKFFHTSVIQRRRRNKAIRLKDVNGCWLEDRADINKSLSAFYQDLFQSEGYRDMDQVLSYVKEVISNEDNTQLTSPISTREIEERSFRLAATKHRAGWLLRFVLSIRLVGS
ncbi:hypothetical protein K1719_043306 [Acacia pycnantha]|nr:hypothetical protein K1719_043306 [Acacia pycnantha]